MAPSAEDTAWAQPIAALIIDTLGTALGGSVSSEVKKLFEDIDAAVAAFTADPTDSQLLSSLTTQVTAMVTALGGTSKEAVQAAVAQLETEIATLDGASTRAGALQAVVHKAKARTDLPDAQPVSAPCNAGRLCAVGPCAPRAARSDTAAVLPAAGWLLTR